jgi:hypothetical protein
MRESVAGQHLARLVEQDDCARGHRRWRRCLVLVLLVCCGTLPLLAQASPPDPTWLPGIYDDADYDDVIGLLTDTAAIRELQLIATGPACLGSWPVFGGAASVVSDPFLLGFHLRSPPTI